MVGYLLMGCLNFSARPAEENFRGDCVFRIGGIDPNAHECRRRRNRFNPRRKILPIEEVAKPRVLEQKRLPLVHHVSIKRP
jgi:hypothetical protein